MIVRFKKLTETAKTPTRGSEDAAGYDLYVDSDKPITIREGETKALNTGIAIEIPKGYFGGVYCRSGLATKRGLRLPNCVGVIDSDYRGNIGVALHNDTDEDQTIQPYERVAQIIIQPYQSVEFQETEELTETARGEGGFGSTGRI